MDREIIRRHRGGFDVPEVARAPDVPLDVDLPALVAENFDPEWCRR